MVSVLDRMLVEKATCYQCVLPAFASLSAQRMASVE